VVVLPDFLNCKLNSEIFDSEFRPKFFGGISKADARMQADAHEKLYLPREKHRSILLCFNTWSGRLQSKTQAKIAYAILMHSSWQPCMVVGRI
jgi:hypothetical protein